MGGLQPLWLLLLPEPPGKVTLSSMRAAYASPISEVLRKAADTSLSFATVTILDVALISPAGPSSRTFQYSELQILLGSIYKLICLLCAEGSIDVQYGNDVDVRVHLVKSPNDNTMDESSSIDPIVSLRRLACCGRPWQRVCSVDNDDSETLLQLFLTLRNQSSDSCEGKIVVERFGSQQPSPASANTTSSPSHGGAPRTRHDAVAVGGTFDHLHAGHKLLLSMTALVLDWNVQPGSSKKKSLTIGITGDKLLENKRFSEQLQDWHQRQVAVEQFLQAFLVVDTPLHRFASSQQEGSKGFQQRTVTQVLSSELTIEYVEIFDAFGPTITNETITALVLSGETRAGGKSVNEKRAERDWPALDIFEVDVLDSATTDAASSGQATDDFQNKLSSTEIRRVLAKRSAAAG
ncbi:MAG: hypothetical protein L6R40_000307 [Gallowayella cf. fulva]|nr:MAG: hypothetical protein L6R40_000307 [Xanthomendoza cf. fulva]